MNEKQIKLREVSYEVKGKKILENIDFEIGEGDRIAVCGPNGAGKSTLMNLMLNIPRFAFSKKTDKVQGKIENTLFDIKNYQDVNVHLQHSRISYNLYLTVGELLNLCLGNHISEELLEKLKLKDKMHCLLRNLSGGEMQKLNIFLVISTNPKVIFLDEMTSGLDYESKKEIVSYIHQYIKKNDCTLVFVTHYLEEILQLADKICFLKDGRIVDQGRMADLFFKYSVEEGNIEALYEEVIGCE